MNSTDQTLELPPLADSIDAVSAPPSMNSDSCARIRSQNLKVGRTGPAELPNLSLYLGAWLVTPPLRLGTAFGTASTSKILRIYRAWYAGTG